MSNNNRACRNLQAFHKNNFSPVQPAITGVTEFFREKLTNTDRSIFSYICRLDRFYGNNVRVSQDTIARNFGITREWANKILNKLKRYGMIDSYYRHMRTCYYRVSPYFNRLDVRLALRTLVGAFYFTLDLLQSKLQQPQSNLSSHKDINKRYIYSPCTILRLTQDIKKPTREYKNKILEIPKYILDIKFIPLTQAGQIKLCAFPEKVVRYSLYQLKKLNNVRSLFNCLMKICLNYCKQNKIHPDWYLESMLRAKFSVPLGADMITKPKNVEKHFSLLNQKQTEPLIRPDFDAEKEYQKIEQLMNTPEMQELFKKHPKFKINIHQGRHKSQLEEQKQKEIDEILNGLGTDYQPRYHCV